MVRIASSKKTKPWENVHDVNIETKLYIMKLIHASSSFIINFETYQKAFPKGFFNGSLNKQKHGR